MASVSTWMFYQILGVEIGSGFPTRGGPLLISFSPLSSFALDLSHPCNLERAASSQGASTRCRGPSKGWVCIMTWTNEQYRCAWEARIKTVPCFVHVTWRENFDQHQTLPLAYTPAMLLRCGYVCIPIKYLSMQNLTNLVANE